MRIRRGRPLIELLFPNGVGSSELYGDSPGLRVLPAEESLISRAVEKRRKEFTTARHCARQALGQLGVEPTPILRGERGMPLWPPQVVGSLTHCDGYRAAVAAFSMQVRSLGIDAEPHLTLPEGVIGHTSVAAERDVLAQRDGDLHWDRLLFCAKEATYKTWFPVTQRWLGFEDAHITFTRDDVVATAADTADDARGSGTFTSRILIDGAAVDGGDPLLELSGRWIVARGLILTAIALT